MQWDVLKGNWKQAAGLLKEQWGKLTDDDLRQVAGVRDQLLGKLQEKYGWARSEAERQLERFENR